jgi:hypothetical protein
MANPLACDSIHHGILFLTGPCRQCATKTALIFA